MSHHDNGVTMKKDWKKLYLELLKKQNEKVLQSGEKWLSGGILLLVGFIVFIVVGGSIALTILKVLDGAMFVGIVTPFSTTVAALLLIIRIMVSIGNKLNGGGNGGV